MGYYCGLLVACSFLNIIYNYPLKNVGGLFATSNRESHTWLGPLLQSTAVFTQLMIIVGLCLDGGKSFTARFLNTRVMQFLGRISMALYLVHMPIMDWVNICIYGVFFEPKPEYARSPLWSTPIQIIISLILASGLTTLLEEPGKKTLRKWKTPQNSRIFRISGTLFLAIGVLFLVSGKLLLKGEILL